MATRQPAMSPSDLPVADVLNRATGPRRAETDELVPAFADRWPELLDTLGKHRASTGCLYLTRLNDVDRDVLRELLKRSLAGYLAVFADPPEGESAEDQTDPQPHCGRQSPPLLCS